MEEDYPVIFETIKNVFDKKNSQDATEGKDVEDVNECDEDNYPTYDIVHWIFNKHTYSRDEFSKEYNKIVEKYVDDDQADDDDRLEEPEILVTYEAWIESEDQLFDNERVTDEELLEEDKEDGMWQVEIMAHLVADNGTYFTREELLQTIKELNNSGNVETVINILTDVGMENLSVPLLGELGRAYNNNSNEKEAIKVLESIDEEYRDAVWYYRCAYAYGALVLDNSDGYTSNTMQQMLRLVDKGVRLATEAKLDDIKSYCFEVIDMCYLKMDFETCEADYPDLCAAYNEYVAEKKKKRKGVPRHRTITVEEIQATDDVWTINEPMYWTINIYGSYDDYIESAKPFTLEQRYLNAISWYFAEVNNGGHHQRTMEHSKRLGK